jgi:hypothetical protein
LRGTRKLQHGIVVHASGHPFPASTQATPRPASIVAVGSRPSCEHSDLFGNAVYCHEISGCSPTACECYYQLQKCFWLELKHLHNRDFDKQQGCETGAECCGVEPQGNDVIWRAVTLHEFTVQNKHTTLPDVNY